MTHFGTLCNPSPTHLMGIAAIGRELQSRGHQFTLFAAPDLAEAAQKHEISFCALPNSRDYLPDLTAILEMVAQQKGPSYRENLRIGIGEIRYYCEQAPKAMSEAGVQCLIGDQVITSARTVAERLKLPFIGFCNSVPLSTDVTVPPSYSPWTYHAGVSNRLRNGFAHGVFKLFSIPFSRAVNSYRRRWGLKPHRRIDDTFSPHAQITQLVREFDFPYRQMRQNLQYVGPFRRTDDRAIPFPYERLDGRPLIFASLGTLLGDTPGIWRSIAEACAGLDAQLVISLGGRGRVEDHKDLPGKPLVVMYAPQHELLRRVKVMISHGGLNSVLEALLNGAPSVALPAINDQPGVAARLQLSGAGETLPFGKCTADTLRPLVQRVFNDATYKTRALAMQQAFAKTGGVKEAADIVERISQS